MQLAREELEQAYRQMKTIRDFEDHLHREIAKGTIGGFTHLYGGQEAIAVGVCENLKDTDYITSTHRGHGHCIAKGCDVKGMMKELYGRADGLCKGKGGSMHVADMDVGMLGANGIVGGGPPLATGAALAAKLDGNGGVALSFGGDGSCNQGPVFESMNIAAILKLPSIYVYENNRYSEHTGSSYVIASESIDSRVEGFGIHTVKANGFDFFEVHEVMKELIALAREGKGPCAVEFETTRFYGHFEGDPQNYRGPDEVKNDRENNDCVKIFRSKVTEAGLLTDEDLDKIDNEVNELIELSAEEAAAAPVPSPEEVTTDVYVSY